MQQLSKSQSVSRYMSNFIVAHVHKSLKHRKVEQFIKKQSHKLAIQFTQNSQTQMISMLQFIPKKPQHATDLVSLSQCVTDRTTKFAKNSKQCGTNNKNQNKNTKKASIFDYQRRRQSKNINQAQAQIKSKLISIQTQNIEKQPEQIQQMRQRKRKFIEMENQFKDIQEEEVPQNYQSINKQILFTTGFSGERIDFKKSMRNRIAEHIPACITPKISEFIQSYRKNQTLGPNFTATLILPKKMQSKPIQASQASDEAQLCTTMFTVKDIEAQFLSNFSNRRLKKSHQKLTGYSNEISNRTDSPRCNQTLKFQKENDLGKPRESKPTRFQERKLFSIALPHLTTKHLDPNTQTR